jgi:hypothetical protein
MRKGKWLENKQLILDSNIWFDQIKAHAKMSTSMYLDFSTPSPTTPALFSVKNQKI